MVCLSAIVPALRRPFRSRFVLSSAIHFCVLETSHRWSLQLLVWSILCQPLRLEYSLSILEHVPCPLVSRPRVSRPRVSRPRQHSRLGGGPC